MDSLMRLGAVAVTTLAQVAGVVAAVVVAWKFFLVVVTGGNERAFGQLLKTLMVIGVSVAVIANAQEVWALVFGLGAELVRTALQTIREAV